MEEKEPLTPPDSAVHQPIRMATPSPAISKNHFWIFLLTLLFVVFVVAVTLSTFYLWPKTTDQQSGRNSTPTVNTLDNVEFPQPAPSTLFGTTSVPTDQDVPEETIDDIGNLDESFLSEDLFLDDFGDLDDFDFDFDF